MTSTSSIQGMKTLGAFGFGLGRFSSTIFKILLGFMALQLLASCGGDDGDGSNNPAFRIALEQENAASATIGPDGGSIETTARDGTRFKLEIPPLALLEKTAITITPALASGTPFSGGALAAIQFEPSGLALWAPGSLTVQLGAAPDPAALVGFGWAGSGGSVGLELVQVTGAQLAYSVTHFSGLGAALAAPADLAALLAGSNTSATQNYQNQTVAACSSSDAATLQTTLRDWYDSAIAPALGAANNDPALTQALRDFEAWRRAVGLVPYLCGLASSPDLGSRLAQGESLAATALKDGIDRAHLRCRSLQNIQGAEDALRWQAIAEAMNLLGAGSGLALDDVLSGLCIEIVYRDTNYASTPQTGVTSPLTAEVEISFPALNNVPFYQPIAVKVDAQGTRETSASGYTDGVGIFTAPFTPDGSGQISFTIKSCYEDPTLPKVSEHVCQTAILVRGLEVQPKTAQIAQGGTQQFSALLGGSTYSNVSWSTTGGMIDGNGQFTGATPGAFTVTATDLADPSMKATATVTVNGGPVGTIVWRASSCKFNPGTGVLVGGNTFCNDGTLLGAPAALPYQQMDTATCSRSLPGTGSASASATADINSNYLTGAGGERNGFHLATSMQASATLMLETPDNGAYASGGGGASCYVEFEIQNGSVPYEASATLAKMTSGGFGNPPLAFLFLARTTPSPPLVIFEVDGQSLSRQGVLEPGRYRTEMNTHADSSFGGGVGGSGTAQASGSFDLRLGPQ